MRRTTEISISTARFANVAFSDGSLLDGFNKRMIKQQPIAAPKDIMRYFITQQESGELCLMSCIFGENRDIFFPKLDDELHLKKFSEIAISFIKNKGFEPYICDSEDQARELIRNILKDNKWPCFFTLSDTTGEKYIEEFYTDNEVLDMKRFSSLGVIKNSLEYDKNNLENFEKTINELKSQNFWDKKSIVTEFYNLIPDFDYFDNGKYLDGKM